MFIWDEKQTRRERSGRGSEYGASLATTRDHNWMFAETYQLAAPRW